MYQAIFTQYLPPTNTKGARIKASAEAGTLTVPWKSTMNVTENHQAAAKAFVEKWGWTGVWVGGGLGHLKGGAAWVSTRDTFAELPTKDGATAFRYLDGSERWELGDYLILPGTARWRVVKKGDLEETILAYVSNPEQARKAVEILGTNGGVSLAVVSSPWQEKA